MASRRGSISSSRSSLAAGRSEPRPLAMRSQSLPPPQNSSDEFPNHRRVGFQRRPFEQTLLMQQRQHEGEHLVVNLQRQPRRDPSQTRMLGSRLVWLTAQETRQRQTVGTPPHDPVL